MKVPSDAAEFLGAAANSVAALAKRLMLHVMALFGGIVVRSTMAVGGAAMPGSAPLSLIFIAYMGLICLFPRGMTATVSGLIPTVSGILLCLLWSFWGVPWQFSLVWGGALAWAVRLLARKGAMGWEWLTVPWLLLAVAFFFGDLRPLYEASTPYWTFPLLAVAGWGALRFYAGAAFETEQRKVLRRSLRGLQEALAAGKPPPPLESPARQLAEKAGRFDALCPRLSEKDAPLVLGLSDVSRSLAGLGTGEGGSAESERKEKIRAAVARLNNALAARLEELAPKAARSPLDEALAARLAEFASQARQLEGKKEGLPLDSRKHILGIGQAVDDILDCMRADPADVAAGERFLSRYLKAAHTVVDEHIHLTRAAGRAAAAEDLARALERSGELLERLEKAFQKEYAALLRNDTITFTAELNVLDKLLKMEGR